MRSNYPDAETTVGQQHQIGATTDDDRLPLEGSKRNHPADHRNIRILEDQTRVEKIEQSLGEPPHPGLVHKLEEPRLEFESPCQIVHQHAIEDRPAELFADPTGDLAAPGLRLA
jgi:hypothetical protein